MPFTAGLIDQLPVALGQRSIQQQVALSVNALHVKVPNWHVRYPSDCHFLAFEHFARF